MKGKFLTVFLLMFLLFSCNDEDFDATFSFGDEFEITPGKTVGTDDRRVALKLVEVNDSRCPSDVICFWQGEAIINFELNYNGITNFTLSTVFNPADTIKNLSIRLVSVEPYPISTRTIELDDYVVKVEIEKITN